MTNVREAIQAMWRPRWEEPKKDKENFVKAFGKDLLTLVGDRRPDWCSRPR